MPIADRNPSQAEKSRSTKPFYKAAESKTVRSDLMAYRRIPFANIPMATRSVAIDMYRNRGSATIPGLRVMRGP